VIGGAMLGALIGWGVYKSFEAVNKLIQPSAFAGADLQSVPLTISRHE
jgi:hypothetical protein